MQPGRVLSRASGRLFRALDLPRRPPVLSLRAEFPKKITGKLIESLPMEASHAGHVG